MLPHMHILPVVLLLSLTVAACKPDETAHAYGAADQIWHLQEIDGQPFAATATLQFPEPGQISGDGPCNLYSGAMTTPYPWFETGNLAVTRRACPDMAAETAFFSALGAMREIEVSGDVLILRNSDGGEMLFTAAGSTDQ